MQRSHRARTRTRNVDLHFHGFDDEQCLSFLDTIAHGDL